MSACNGGGATATKTVTVGGATVTAPPITKIVETGPAGSLELTVNGQKYSLTGIKPSYTLSFVLRDKCLLPGTKIGCNRG